LSATHEIARPFSVAVLAHRRDPQVPPCPRVAAKHEAAGGENLVPEQLGRLVEQDDVHPPFRCKVSEGYRHGYQEGATRDPFRGRQDRHVQVAVRPGRAARPRAEDGHGRDSRDRFHGTGQLLIDLSHEWDRSTRATCSSIKTWRRFLMMKSDRFLVMS
jgi:hypothetical protein